jgi:hypothetical protein
MKDEHQQSQLFTLRIWLEADADDQIQWRGKLRHVPSGEIRHFRGWAALIPLMLDMLHRYAIPDPGDGNPTSR